MSFLNIGEKHGIRLRGKLLIAFLMAAVLPFVLLGIAASILSESALKNNITESLGSDLKTINGSLENYLENLKGGVSLIGGRNISSLDTIRNLIEVNNNDLTFKIYAKRYEPHFQGFMESYKDVIRIILVGTVINEGKQKGRIAFVAAPVQKQEQGEQLTADSETASCLQTLGSEFVHKGDKNPIAQAYYRALTEKKVVVLDFQELNKGTPSLWMAMPVFAEEGQIFSIPYVGDGKKTDGQTEQSDMAGVVIAEIAPLKSISKILSREGSVKSYLIGKNSNGVRVFRYHDNASSLGTKLPGYFEKALVKSELNTYIDENNNRYIAKSFPLDFQGLAWEVLIQVDEKSAFSDVQKLRWLILIIGFFGFVFINILAFTTVAVITKPLNQVVDNLKDIAEGEGDLTSRLDIKSRDETGELAMWFNLFLDKIQGIIRDISDNAGTLQTSSGSLSDLSSRMSSVGGEMASKFDAVTVAAQEVSSNVTAVASSVEETSINVSIVASSAEEMTSTIDEIAKNSEKARFITSEVAANAHQVNNSAQELGKVAQDIGKVTETITEISEQTNLLALNATIEAARAGEAGKGFAVVANEIKELARQTAKATLQIKTQIEGIQGSTDNTIREISQITTSINEVNEIVSAISASVEEQSVTTKEIAENVAQASNGISEVNQNLAQSSKIVENIAQDITGLNQYVGEISDTSTQADSNSKDLSTLADQLNKLIGRFKI
jgi:methyl-accepting chemotaxis protein